MKVLVACEYSGVVTAAFRAAGHDAFSCDLLPSEATILSSVDHPTHFQCDVRLVLDWGWDLMIAHPPCTYLCNSGVRWMDEERHRKMELAAAFYQLLWSAPIPRIAIENPVMHGYAKRALGIEQKRQVVQPWWFGDPTFKGTGFLLKNLPPLKATKKLTPPKPGTDEHKAWSWVHRTRPSPNRWRIRSRTSTAIAAAMAAQWGTL